MSKFVVTVFQSEEQAYKGSKAMLDLHADGSIVLFAGAVITKDSSGVLQIEDAADEGPIGTATGMMLGTLIGGLGALAAGATGGAAAAAVAAGAAGGSLGGWYSDLYNVGVDGQFLSDVGELMLPGTSAVVAEIAEGWTTPLDVAMTDLGGVVFRRYRIDVEDAQIERDLIAAEMELEELEEEWNQATDEAKESLQAKVDAAKANVAGLKAKAQAKIDSLKAEAQAKIDKLNERIEIATDEAKAKFEKTRDQLKADYEERSAKLAEAAHLTKEALTP